ncbi:MAG: hypothetical protein HY680_01215, partial [Chloroflexi bacterium]|nr:hypothetical protein [Chloroflexota bacterium]
MFKPHRLLTLVLVLGIAAIASGACGGAQEPAATPTPTAAAAVPTATTVAAAPTATTAAARPTVAVPTATPTSPRPTATPTPSGPTGSLRIAMVNLGTENWLQRLAMDEQAILNLMGDTLLSNDRQNRLPSPGLVEAWEMSGDGLTWTFHLKKGIQFNEGW